MGKQENKLKNKILLSIDEKTQRLFRANAGTAWQGKTLRHTSDRLILQNPRPFHGMPEGFPDLFGWTKKIITPEMVGNAVAVFTATEIKATGTMSDEQKNFMKLLVEMGGIHEVKK